MAARISFVLIVIFWVTMNALLWRSYSGGQQSLADYIPVETVWEKILTAQDHSSLEILHHGKKIGYCTWVASVKQAQVAIPTPAGSDLKAEGMVENITGYAINLDGNASIGDETDRVRFEASLKLSTNQNWRQFHLRASLRPTTWIVNASAASETLNVRIEDDDGVWKKQYRFADLQHPEKLLEDFGGPYALGLLGGLGMPVQKESLSRVSLEWKARHDTMQFGHSRVKVYRLETRVLGQPIFVFVSRAGEILWVELPDKLIFCSDAFNHF